MLRPQPLPISAIVTAVVSVFITTHSSLGQTDSTNGHNTVTTQKKVNAKGPAYTEAPSNDPNFALMGEFLGEISEQENATRLGLQVRAIGKDQFGAIAYRGGLPGQPELDLRPIHMIGRRSGDFVILSGGPWAVFVYETNCVLIDDSGEKVGELKRIKRSSPTLHAPAPTGATVLFDGTDTKHFKNGRMSLDGLLKEGADVKPMFQDFNLHVEFRLPYMPLADLQNRGNSGLYLQSRYECQVLDSFATIPVFNGLGAIYRTKTPDVNMALPPLTWQTYDVIFTAPRWESDGSKLRNATISSWVNGVKVQDNISLPSQTGAGKVEKPFLLPIRFQDHGDPVRYRNIWILDRGLATMPQFPVFTTKKQRTKADEVLAEQQRLKTEREKKAKDAERLKAAKAEAETTKLEEEVPKEEAPKEEVSIGETLEEAVKGEALKEASDTNNP